MLASLSHPLFLRLTHQAKLTKPALVHPCQAARGDLPRFVQRANEEARVRGWPMNISIDKSSGSRHILSVKCSGETGDDTKSVSFSVNYDPHRRCGWLAFKDVSMYARGACDAGYDMNFLTSSTLAFWCWEMLGGVVPTDSGYRRAFHEETLREEFKATITLIRKDMPHLSGTAFSDLIKSKTFPKMTDAEFKAAMEYVLVAA